VPRPSIACPIHNDKAAQALGSSAATASIVAATRVTSERTVGSASASSPTTSSTSVALWKSSWPLKLSRHHQAWKPHRSPPAGFAFRAQSTTIPKTSILRREVARARTQESADRRDKPKSFIHFQTYRFNILTTRAGTPATRVWLGTSRFTTDPAPTTLPSPIVTPGKMVTQAAIHAPRSIVTGRPMRRPQRLLGSLYLCESVIITT
jgi:hypothetical protein